VGFEGINLLNCAIGPFGLQRPLVAIAESHVKNRFLQSLDHFDIYAAFLPEIKIETLPYLN
jgi:hypothetical protein